MTPTLKTFPPKPPTPRSEAEREAALAKLIAVEDTLTALCATEGGITLLATVLGYEKVAPTTKSLP